VKAFWVIKRFFFNGRPKGLFVKMYAGDLYSASRPVANREEAKVAFREFIAGVRKETAGFGPVKRFTHPS